MNGNQRKRHSFRTCADAVVVLLGGILQLLCRREHSGRLAATENMESTSWPVGSGGKHVDGVVRGGLGRCVAAFRCGLAGALFVAT